MVMRLLQLQITEGLICLYNLRAEINAYNPAIFGITQPTML